MGDTAQLAVKTLSAEGQGLAFWKGRTVSVEGALPGERVLARLTRGRHGQLQARVLEVQAASPSRVEPRCRHFGVCGGCRLQHLDYPQQLLWKRQMLERFLAEATDLKPEGGIRVVPMEFPWAYRNKLEFTFGQEGDRVTLGLHQRGSFQRIVDVVQCEIAPPAVSTLLAAVKEAVNRSGLAAYNPRIHQGFWRYAVVRSGHSGGDLLLLLVTNEGPREALEATAEVLLREVPVLKSLYWGVSTKVSDVATAERIVFLGGQEVLEDEVAGIRFQIGPTQFVQPNLALAARVYESIRRQAGLSGKETVYDLYCGIGLVALSLALNAQWVYGVESEQENVRFAERNAELNGIANATFLWGRLEDLLKGRALFRAGPKPDVVVLDPPRAGLHPEVYGPLLETRAPTLLYLSCNPSTLARDLKVFCQRDPRYRLDSVELFDFFPHTTHSEILVTLRR